MTRVLLTGGSGFIAAHVLDLLLERGHSVVTTVRSQEKADKIKKAHPKFNDAKLSFAIVEDIAKAGAFEHAVKSDPPFEAVIHTASPFHFNAKDLQKDLLDPAINGTKGVLEAIKASAPTVKRVVITSSFAAIIDPSKGARPGYTYTEADWSPLTPETSLKDQPTAYRGSKTLAEKAAWKFVEEEKPNFTLATICPPLVFGPIVHYLNSLEALNTSNQRIRDLIQGKNKEEIPETGTYAWVDVRDIAMAHVKAMETSDAANKRFFIVAGAFNNKMVTEIIRSNFSEYASSLPSKDARGGQYPEGGFFKTDNSRSREILGLNYGSLDDCIVDTVKSFKAVGA